MKRSDLIQDLVKIYETRPDGCSSYHIIDMLIYAAEKRGMLPPATRKTEILTVKKNDVEGDATIVGDFFVTRLKNEWDEDDNIENEDEDLDSDAEARKSFWELNQEIKTMKLSDIFKKMDENKKRTPTKQQLDELAEVLNNIESEDEE